MLIKENEMKDTIRNNFEEGILPFYVGRNEETNKEEVVNFENETHAIINGDVGGAKTSLVRNFLYGVKNFIDEDDVNIYIYDKNDANGYDIEFGEVDQVKNIINNVEDFSKVIKEFNKNREDMERYLKEQGAESILDYKINFNKGVKKPYNIFIIDDVSELIEDLKQNLNENDFKNTLSTLEIIAVMGRMSGFKLMMTIGNQDVKGLKVLRTNSSVKYINSSLEEDKWNKILGDGAEKYKGTLEKDISKGLLRTQERNKVIKTDTKVLEK